MPTSRKLSIALSLLSVLLLIAGLFLPWWTGKLAEGSFSLDLRSMEMCIGGNCYDRPLSSIGTGWAQLGSAVLAASIITSCLLLWCTERSLHARFGGVGFWVSGAMSMFTGLLTLVFIFVRPDSDEWIPSYGLACTLVASFLGALATTIAASSAGSQKR